MFNKNQFVQLRKHFEAKFEKEATMYEPTGETTEGFWKNIENARRVSRERSHVLEYIQEFEWFIKNEGLLQEKDDV